MDSSAVTDLLLRSFGTALLSTFTAVVLAYVFAPLVIRLWHWTVGVEPTEVSGSDSLDALKARLVATSREVSALGTAVKALTGAVETLRNGLPVDAVGKIEKAVNEVAKETREFREHFGKHAEAQLLATQAVAKAVSDGIQQQGTRLEGTFGEGLSQVGQALKAVGENLKGIDAEARSRSNGQMELARKTRESVSQSGLALEASFAKSLSSLGSEIRTSVVGISDEVEGVRMAVAGIGLDREIQDLRGLTERLETGMGEVRRQLTTAQGPLASLGSGTTRAGAASSHGPASDSGEGRFARVVRLLFHRSSK